MRETFKGWYEPASEDVEELWASGMIVTDTNVLLDLYRLTPKSRESLLKALKSASDRLWIPHQVGLEFHRSRDEARSDTRRKHTDLAQRIVNDTRKLVKQVADLRTFNPAVDNEGALRNELATAAGKVAEELKSGLDEYDEADEVVLDEVDELFPAQRIGTPFSSAELLEARAEAAHRFEAKIPPGFADGGKAGDPRYGDYFLWKQLMARAEVMKSGVIFITRDEKQDWRKEGEVLPELAYEFSRVTNNSIIILHPDTFIKESLTRGMWQASADEDVQQVSDDYRRVAQADAHAEVVARNYTRLADAITKTGRLSLNLPETSFAAPNITSEQLKTLGAAIRTLQDSAARRAALKADNDDEDEDEDGMDITSRSAR